TLFPYTTLFRSALHRRMTGVVIHVARTGHAFEPHPFLHQVLVDVDDPRARKYFLELVALQLVVTGAAAHHHGADVQIVERVRNAVEEDAVVGGDLLRSVELTRTPLRIAAAEVSRR